MADSSDFSTAKDQRGDSRTADKIWVMYNDQAEGYDNRLAASWKGDTEGILIFTGLFSATVAAFIIEGYKTLSPDTGDATVALLSMILQQGAAASANGTRPLPSELRNPFTPTASAVRVNVLWFMSLIMSLTCALAATLMQQWVRQYTQASQRSAAPYKRARIRTFLFQGVEKFHLAGAVEFIPALLHTSVFLFFAGLVDFMMAINHTVAYTALTCSLLTAAAYTVSTVLPLFSLNSPYRTPLSGAVWSTWHGGAEALTWCLKMALQICAPILMAMRPSWKAQLPPLPPSGPRKWMQKLGTVVQQCRVQFVLGMRACVERGATDAPKTLDGDALGWAVVQLEHVQEWEVFVEGIAELARSSAHLDFDVLIMDLMTPGPTRDIPLLATYLHSLLLDQFNAAGLTHESRNQRELSYVTAIWYTLEAFNNDTAVRSPPAYLRTYFHTSIDLHSYYHVDTRVAVTAICAQTLLRRLAVVEGQSNGAATKPDIPVYFLQSRLVGDGLPRGAHTPYLVNLTLLVEDIVPFLRGELLPEDILQTVWRTIAIACRMDAGQAAAWPGFFEIANVVKELAHMQDNPSPTRHHHVEPFSRLFELLRPVYLDLVYAHLLNPTPWPAVKNSYQFSASAMGDKQEYPRSGDEDDLLARITAVCHIVEAYPWGPDENVLCRFGDVSLTRRLRTAREPFIMVIGRCMRGLIADKLSYIAPTMPRHELILAELLELPLHEVGRGLNGRIANLIGVVQGILPMLVQEQLSDDCLAIVWRTLEILRQCLDFLPPSPDMLLDIDYATIVALTKDIEARARACRRQPWTDVEVRFLPRLHRLGALLSPIGEMLQSAQDSRLAVAK